jgi:hypothetical protein
MEVNIERRTDNSRRACGRTQNMTYRIKEQIDQKFLDKLTVSELAELYKVCAGVMERNGPGVF